MRKRRELLGGEVALTQPGRHASKQTLRLKPRIRFFPGEGSGQRRQVLCLNRIATAKQQFGDGDHRRGESGRLGNTKHRLFDPQCLHVKPDGLIHAS